MNRFKAKIKTQSQGFRRWLSGRNDPLFLAYYRYAFKPKPNSLDFILERYSKSTQAFVVLQIGANDGITNDPIHKFIKRDRWSEVLLEPQNHVYHTLLKPIYRHHKELVLVNAAIGEQDGEASLYKISFSNDRWATGLSTFVKPSLQHMVDDGTIKARAAKYGSKPPADSSTWIAEEKVQVLSPQTIIKNYNLSRINLLMVDAEGFDYEVVKMVLNAGVLPLLIVFECFHLSPKDLAESEQLVHAKGYDFKRLGPNMLAWQPEINPLIQF